MGVDKIIHVRGKDFHGGTVLVFGDCVRAPPQVVIKEVNPKPRSHDPEFLDH